jgi:hypothetical protein
MSQIPNGWPATFTLPGLPLFTWQANANAFGQWNTDPADSAILVLTGQEAIDQDYFAGADLAKFYLAVSLNVNPQDIYEAASVTGPFALLGTWEGNDFIPGVCHNGDFAAILIDNLFGRRNSTVPMELTARLNKIASDRSTAGKQNALLAIAALVLLDKDNNVQFDADDLPGTLARILAAGDVALPTGKTIGTDEQPYAESHSYQPVSPDLNLDPAAGSTIDDPKFLAAVMGNIIGDTLTKQGAYLAGLIGALSILGVRATKYQIAALLGIVMDGVTDADAAVLAVIDGSDPSSITRARAAFAVAMNNNNAGSGVDYGLDLFDEAVTRLAGAFSGTAKPFAIAKALTRSPHEVCQLESADVPVDGTTGLNFAGKGSKCVDYTHGEEYINTGTKAAPVWKKLTHA